MKAALKNWLLLIRNNCFFTKKQVAFLCNLFFYLSKAQIANYVNNGSFEDCINCYSSTQLLIAKYWNAIDTTKYYGFNLTALLPSGQVPNSSFTHQYPKTGNNYLLSTLLFINTTTLTARGYPRNRLKGNLHTGKTYCVKIYYNITNQSSYGVDGLGAYFGDNTVDTISQCDKPIAFLTPQLQNPTNNILSDTLNWSLLTGTFVANGTEKYMVLGNFKSDVATNSVIINPTNLPLIATDVLFDDISVIDIALPAYAGPDIYAIPGNTVYLGRPQDVGIDEACMWYQLPNTSTAIDTAAGITLTVASVTSTYMVKQDICGNIKYDTVIVYASGVGLQELAVNAHDFKIYPNPVQDVLQITQDAETEILTAKIYTNIGQLIYEEELTFKNKNATIKTEAFPNGVYLLNLSSKNLINKNTSYYQYNKSLSVSKRFVIAR